MLRLAAVIYVLAATVLAGSAVTVLLALRLMEPWQLASAFLAGVVVAVPVSWLLGRKIYTALNAPAVRHV